jgi:[ribosomal protein S18]-alanine N-acetyltransferase
MSSKKAESQVTIDLMGKADLPEILAIEKESFISPWSPGMFTEEIENKLAQCMVIRITDKGKSIIGAYIVFRLIADEAHLHNLAVKKEFKRHGLAQILLETMKNIATQVGINACTLEVRESNQEAINLYRKCGFVVKGRRPLYYTDTHEDALIMWADVK